MASNTITYTDFSNCKSVIECTKPDLNPGCTLDHVYREAYNTCSSLSKTDPAKFHIMHNSRDMLSDYANCSLNVMNIGNLQLLKKEFSEFEYPRVDVINLLHPLAKEWVQQLLIHIHKSTLYGKYGIMTPITYDNFKDCEPVIAISYAKDISLEDEDQQIYMKELSVDNVKHAQHLMRANT
jgi:hypothetical protein